MTRQLLIANGQSYLYGKIADAMRTLYPENSGPPPLEHGGQSAPQDREQQPPPAGAGGRERGGSSKRRFHKVRVAAHEDEPKHDDETAAPEQQAGGPHDDEELGAKTHNDDTEDSAEQEIAQLHESLAISANTLKNPDIGRKSSGDRPKRICWDCCQHDHLSGSPQCPSPGAKKFAQPKRTFPPTGPGSSSRQVRTVRWCESGTVNKDVEYNLNAPAHIANTTIGQPHSAQLDTVISEAPRRRLRSFFIALHNRNTASSTPASPPSPTATSSSAPAPSFSSAGKHVHRCSVTHHVGEQGDQACRVWRDQCGPVRHQAAVVTLNEETPVLSAGPVLIGGYLSINAGCQRMVAGEVCVGRASATAPAIPLLASKDFMKLGSRIMNLFQFFISFTALGIYDLPSRLCKNGHLCADVSAFPEPMLAHINERTENEDPAVSEVPECTPA